MEENKIVEITTEDKIVLLKKARAGMELLGDTIPQITKDAVAQEITRFEAMALEEEEKAKANTVSFYTKYRTETIIITATVIINVLIKLVG